jgi:hypothetical protein
MGLAGNMAARRDACAGMSVLDFRAGIDFAAGSQARER